MPSMFNGAPGRTITKPLSDITKLEVIIKNCNMSNARYRLLLYSFYTPKRTAKAETIAKLYLSLEMEEGEGSIAIEAVETLV
jgi:hypothetical protein